VVQLDVIQWAFDCARYLDGDRTRVHAWERLLSAAEECSQLAVDCVLRLIREARAETVVGAVAAGPLWELLECRDRSTLIALEQSLAENERLGHALVAIARYSRKVSRLQRALCRLTSCAHSTSALRPMAREDLIQRAREIYGDDQDILLMNPWLPEERHQPGGLQPLMKACLSEQSTEERARKAVELESLFLQNEEGNLPAILEAVANDKNFPGCLHDMNLFGWSEPTVDAILRAVESGR
jgi:hypothetical protein